MSTGRVIKLARTWTLGRQIGGGGFGRVFEATDQSGARAAVKLVGKRPGADREVLIARDVTGVKNVVELLDDGEDGGDYALVMPLADRSLGEELAARAGPLPPAEAVAILADLAEALAGVAARDIVSRDVKPENALLIGAAWHLSDFGIARYAEATTGPETFKYHGTAAYTAPERWLGERATPASDVYSFGVMAYQMLAGALPFGGPDLGDQHRHATAPPLPGIPPKLASLVMECLYKPPEARPTAANILARLGTVLAPSSGGAALLQEANRAVVEERAKAEAKLAAARTEEQRREALAAVAKQSLDNVIAALDAAIAEAAPGSERTNATTATGWARALGKATIQTNAVQPANLANFGPRQPPFDLLAFTSIGVRIPTDAYGYDGRSHSLWFCDAKEQGVYRWYETAFMHTPFPGNRASSSTDPFALPPGPEAGQAIGPGIGTYQVAWPFQAFDQGDEAGFIDRWLAWFGQGAQGQLGHPQRMPELPDASKSWRR